MYLLTVLYGIVEGGPLQVFGFLLPLILSSPVLCLATSGHLELARVLSPSPQLRESLVSTWVPFWNVSQGSTWGNCRAHLFPSLRVNVLHCLIDGQCFENYCFVPFVYFFKSFQVRGKSGPCYYILVISFRVKQFELTFLISARSRVFSYS